MQEKRQYAWKAIWPRLWKGIFYALIAAAALVLSARSGQTADLVLAWGWTAFTFCYICGQAYRYVRTYYQMDDTGVTVVRNGVAQRAEYGELESAQYDKNRMGLELVYRDGQRYLLYEYTNLSPLTYALDEHGIRVEYKRF